METTGQLGVKGRVVKDYHINIFYSEENEGYIADKSKIIKNAFEH